MFPLLVAGLLAGAAFAGSLVVLVAAVRGWRPTFRHVGGPRRRLLTDAAAKRGLVALGIGLVVLVLTPQWWVAAAGATALVWLWPRMFGGAKAGAAKIERLEALATWTESLRDSIQGSMGLAQALKSTSETAPEILQASLQRMRGRLRAHVSLEESLAEFAHEFEDSSAELVVAALILNSRLSGPGLVRTLSALAASARAELKMRRRVEERRKSLRREARAIVATTGIFAAAEAVFMRQFVSPYSTVGGEMMLLLIITVVGAGLMWLRSAANVKEPARFLVLPEQVAALIKTGGAR